MKHKERTKDQLINELEKLRHRIAEFKASETKHKQTKEALKKSEERYRSLFKLAPDSIVILDMKGVVTSCNNTAFKTSGYTKDEIVGKHFTKLGALRKKDIPEYLKMFNSLFKGKMPSPFEFVFYHKDGTTKWGEAHVSLLKIDGRKVGIQAILRDISERKRAEEALRESEERLHHIFEGSLDAIFITGEDSRFVDVNEATSTLTGYSKEELKKMVIPDLHETTDLHAYKTYFHRIMEGEEITSEAKIIRKDGTKVDTEFNNRVIMIKGKPYMHTVARDITARKKTEEEIKIHQEKLRSLASRLSLAEEEERRRIARMLHDNLAQKLALAKVKLGVLREPLSAPDLVKSIDEIRELIQETIQDTSSLTFELSPPILYELGLAAAMEWLTEQIQDKYNIQIDFENDEQPTLLGNDISIALFQAVRELLINAVKHSQANKVKVSSCGDGKKIQIRVEDNGIGFKVSEMQPYFVKTGGFGLFNIHERLEQLGGHMEIESKPGHGTQVALVAPLEGGEKVSNQK